MKDLLVEYRGTIEDLQDGLKSRDAEIKRITEAQVYSISSSSSSSSSSMPRSSD